MTSKKYFKSTKTLRVFSGIIICVIASMAIILPACRKQNTVTTSQIYNDTYLRTLSFPGFQSGHCLKQTDDGNVLLFWIDYTDTTASQISKINLDGTVLWKRKVLGNLDGSYFVSLNDGSILISSWGTFIKLDKNGEVLIESFPDSGGGFPVRMGSKDKRNGYYMFAFTNGGGTGSASTNGLEFLDNNGNDSAANSLYFPDTYFNSKVVRLNAFRYEDPNTYYFWGYGMIKWTGNWSANPHTFFAKIQLDSTNTTLVSKKILFVDSTDNVNFNSYNYVAAPYQLVNDDKSILISQSLINSETGLTHGHLIKVDSSLKLLWERDIPFEDSNNEVNSIEKCPDGAVLISGRTFAKNSKIYSPFFCKIDKNGNLLWKNTLATPRFGEAWWGIPLREGGYMFTGNTTSFGKDINGQDLFILKTDNFGNLK